MRRGAVAIVLLLLLVSAAAMVHGRNINAEPTGLKLSECYGCHEQGGGSFGPPIAPLYLIHAPRELTIEVGEPVELTLSVQNTWTADLMEFVGMVNVSAAPQLAFTMGREPLIEEYEVEVSTPELDPSNPAFFFGERTERLAFAIEGGASDFSIAVTPRQTTAGLAPDFALRLWPEADPTRPAPIVVDEGGPGETESFTLAGAAAVAEWGVGPWTAEIVHQDPSIAPGGSGAIEQVFDVVTQQEFRSTGEPIALRSSDTTLASAGKEPSARADMSWIVVLEEPLEGPAVIQATVDLTAHFEHSTVAPDWWRFTKTIDIHLVPLPGENAALLSTAVVEVAPLGVEPFPWAQIGEIIGYISSFLLVASMYSGGIFGKKSRRQLNAAFGTAKRRVAFHNFLSYGILAAAVGHTVVFIFPEEGFAWTRGIIWGGVAILAMVGLGVTGALQVPMIRKWSYAGWRWTHFGLAIAAVAFTVVHMLLDGANFGDVQRAVGWQDPLE